MVKLRGVKRRARMILRGGSGGIILGSVSARDALGCDALGVDVDNVCEGGGIWMQSEPREKLCKVTRVGIQASLGCSIHGLLCEANSGHGNNRDPWCHLGGGKPLMCSLLS